MTDFLMDSRIQDGIQLFNEREFFACHDVLEDYWSELTGREKSFFQGLIQAAVALFHFEEGNLGGARRMYVSCRANLAGFPQGVAGIDGRQLIQDLDACFAELCEPHTEYPFHVRLNPELIPVIVRKAPDPTE